MWAGGEGRGPKHVVYVSFVASFAVVFSFVIVYLLPSLMFWELLIEGGAGRSKD